MSTYIETNFDESSGIVPCLTPWGSWWQTTRDVQIEIKLPEVTKCSDINIVIKPSYLSVTVAGKSIFEGQLYKTIIEDEAVWTLEDKKLIRIVLTKAEASAGESIWEGLLKDKFFADPLTCLEMRKKVDLENFQIQHGGFDFSGAEMSKTYETVPESMLKRMEERQKECEKAATPNDIAFHPS